MRSLSYLAVSLRKVLLREGRRCPSCGARDTGRVLDRKWFVTSLRRCRDCKLLYRVPTTTEAENERLYEAKYKEGFTTELPDLTVLKESITGNFKETPKDYTVYVDVLRALGVHEGADIYDFGCSWGYGTYQLRSAGFNCEGYEMSRRRANFATEQLGIRMRCPEQLAERCFDVFFSAHVLEHVPSIEKVLAMANRALRPGGWFVAFTPNGSLERRRRDPVGWHLAWGFVHPQLLDREWVNSRAGNMNLVVDTDPYDLDGIRNGRVVPRWDGSELLIAYRKPVRN